MSSCRAILGVILLWISVPAFGWWHCGWSDRLPVNIAAPPGPALNDYQVRIDLDSSSVPPQFDWSLNGDDLRIVDQDDQTELNYFVEQWDVAGQRGVLWARVPLIPAGGRTIYIYFGAPSGTAASSSVTTFTETGLKFHTRRSAANPVNRSTAENAFAAGADDPGYGCEMVADYTNLSNRNVFSPPSRNSDIAVFAEAFFEVAPGQAGTWEFRYGADFGRGGGLYVDDVPLEEDWNSDLWWAFNWNNAAEVLQGTTNLSVGFHSVRILGFEGCCDGGLNVEFRRPGGPWLAMSLANLNFVSRRCPVTTEPVATIGALEPSPCPSFNVVRNALTESDPVNTTTNPKAIPGSTVINTVEITNTAAGTADTGSVVITDRIPLDAALQVTDFDGATSGPVRFDDGSPVSGLSYIFTSLGSTTDDVAFSNNNGATYNYTPSPDASGVDTTVTHIRIIPSGAFQGSGGGGDPSATFAFKTILQ